MELPNLDAMSVTELHEFSRIARLAARYAHHKAWAMQRRLNGEIEQALRIEGLCDAIYKKLPADVRW